MGNHQSNRVYSEIEDEELLPGKLSTREQQKLNCYEFLGKLQKYRVAGEGGVFNFPNQQIEITSEVVCVTVVKLPHVIRIIIPLKDKEKAFREAGYDVSTSLSLLDQDILLRVINLEEDKTDKFEFYALRSCIKEPHAHVYYWFRYNHRTRLCYIVPSVSYHKVGIGYKKKPLTLWTNFPNCRYSSQIEEGYILGLTLQPDNYDYDFPQIIAKIRAQIESVNNT